MNVFLGVVFNALVHIAVLDDILIVLVRLVSVQLLMLGVKFCWIRQ